jgi:2'-5' RNA ligase
MREKFIKINIAIKPPEKVAEKVMAANSETGNKYKVDFALDGINYYPHLTLYHVECPEKNLENIFQTLEKLLPKLGRIKLAFREVGREQISVSVYFSLSQEIRDFHEKIIEKINPLRDGRIRDKYRELGQVSNLTSEQKENILKYGHPELMNLYKPHITIARLEDEVTAEKAVNEIKWEASEFIVDKISVFRSGKHGTCVEIIKEFSLGK